MNYKLAAQLFLLCFWFSCGKKPEIIPQNQPPIIDAGRSISIELPNNTAPLQGIASDPDGDALIVQWTKSVGPKGELIAFPNNLVTDVGVSLAGNYVFRLTVTDNHGNKSVDSVNLLVKDKPFDGDYLLVSSRNTHSIKMYDALTGQYIKDLIGTQTSVLSNPQDLRWSVDKKLLVTGLNNSAVLKYEPSTGSFLGSFTSGYALRLPTKMSLGPDGLLYISQWNKAQNNIARFNAQTGIFVDEYASNGGLDGPLGHAWDKEGNFYVASFFTGDVRKFDQKGNFMDIFVAGVPNQTGPSNIWFDKVGNLWVVDWYEGTVKIYDKQGKYIKTAVSGLANAEGVEFESNSNMLLCNYSAHTIQRYDSLGNFIRVFASGGGLNTPNALLLKK